MDLGFNNAYSNCKLVESTILTLYSLNEDNKKKLLSDLEKELEKKGLDKDLAELYNIEEIMEEIEAWKSKSKDMYRELFEALNKILEETR